MFPSFAKGSFVVKKRKLLDDVVHNQVNIDRRLVSNMLYESLA